MVRIVNGEIVDDKDSQQNSSRPAERAPGQFGRQQPQVAPQAAERPFWQRTPFRLRHDVPPLYGLPLPDVEIFGFHLTAQQLLIAAALTVFFGWRMLVFLAILFVIVKVNSSPPSAPRAAGTGSGGGGGGSGTGFNQAGDFMREYLATNPTRPSGGSHGGQSKDSWGTRGKGQKLGSA